MVTAIVSDLHLGTTSGADVARGPAVRERLMEALAPADRVVLLGDALELRERPAADVMELARPLLEELGEVTAGRQLVIVPGNHDHHLIEPWLEQRSLAAADPLELEQLGEPSGQAFEVLAAQAAAATVRFAYPGIWINDRVYATHGHYLDRHLTVPTIERIGVAAVERILGVPGG